jgi:hypothetical protein
LPLLSTGGSQPTTDVRPPTSLAVRLTGAPGGRPRATQSLVLPKNSSGTQPLTPAGMMAFGVAVQVGLGPGVCGAGTTVAEGVGGCGLGVGGAAVGAAAVGELVVARGVAITTGVDEGAFVPRTGEAVVSVAVTTVLALARPTGLAV